MTKKAAKKPGQATLNPTRRDNTGALLCTAVARCDNHATVQATVVCGGCQDVRDETDQAIARKHAQVAEQERAEQAILDAARNDDRELTDLERLAVVHGAQERQQAGADLVQLTAAMAAVVDDHTHPVYACDKHASRLVEG